MSVVNTGYEAIEVGKTEDVSMRVMFFFVFFKLVLVPAEIPVLIREQINSKPSA